MSTVVYCECVVLSPLNGLVADLPQYICLSKYFVCFLLSPRSLKVMVWRLHDSDQLEGMAFLDTQAYIHQIVCLKNFVLLADFEQSITLASYNEKGRTLAYLSRDVHRVSTYAVDFMVHGDQLAFVVNTDEKNVLIFAYDRDRT